MSDSEDKKKDHQDLEDIDVGTRFQILAEGTDVPVNCIYVGMKKDKHFAVTFPLDDTGSKIPFSPDIEVKITCLYQDKYFEFYTKIIQTHTHPVDLLILNYPKALKRIEQRVHPRINCFIAAEVTIKISDSNEVLKGVIKDISKGGCLYLIACGVQDREAFRVGEHVSLKCTFPGIMGEQETMGTVIGIQQEEGDTAVRIQFPEPLWWVPPYP